MAIWQFDVVVTDQEGQRSLPEAVRMRAESFLVGLMPASIEGTGWTMFGSDEGNRIDINFDGRGCEIGVRIDARSEAHDFISLVCLMVATLDCALFSDEFGEPIPSDVSSLKEALQRSAAWQFALGTIP
ncbi:MULTISPECIES: hypothetical protein [unclassified Roseateles]|uniref:hypothetical protein n=1 Tax=unclassified Roseateles TaxID=2626991 RepID=UPI0006FDD2E0|nr:MULTISPECIES: hypothetical protein [unclassified Roseateles]KQW43313.1 hypothetical protein ASC81_16085 [Pelomonas sp. Root405]KRA71051.1 hypothetical protein ASD88_14610 [Pelomonas sp. Root662]